MYGSFSRMPRRSPPMKFSRVGAEPQASAPSGVSEGSPFLNLSGKS